MFASMLAMLSVGSIIASFLPDSARDKWLEERNRQCFEAGGAFDFRRDTFRCIHRDGRIEIKVWQDIK